MVVARCLQRLAAFGTPAPLPLTVQGVSIVLVVIYITNYTNQDSGDQDARSMRAAEATR